jgi:hypothetical protein
MKRKVEIKKVTPVEANGIIENRQPRGLFYCLSNGVYVGIDNTYGDAWTEDFPTLNRCKRWLGDPNIHVEGGDTQV